MATYQITAPDGGTYEVTAPDGASQADVLSYAQSKFATKPEPSLTDSVLQGAKDFGAGLVRGAGSIGATIVDLLRSNVADPVQSATPENMRPAVSKSLPSLPRGEALRQGMDAGLQEMGADPSAMLYKGGKLTGEIAGTAGAGNLLAVPVRALTATRFASGIEPLINGVARGLETGGFRVGDLAGTSAALPVRAATGAATGAMTAGMVNPEDAATGAKIGAIMPGSVAVAGKTGDLLSKAFRTTPTPNPVMLDTARASMDAGYTIPPSMVNPSFRNRTLESLSGKFETAQLASTKNQQVTDSLVRKALGLPEDAPLTQESMQALRKQAGQVYQGLKGTGTITADKTYTDALDKIGQTVKSATASFPKLGPTNMHGKPIDEIGQLVGALKQPQFDAGGAVDTIAFLRDQADTAFAAGDKAMGRASKAAATALEDMLDRHLQQVGAADMLPAYRNARQLIAKTYTVEKGLREGAGVVDARAIGRELQKGKPLSGDLLTVGQFGNTFNKAAQPPQLIGSPAVNVLKPALSFLTGAAGGAAMGPAGIGLGALNYVVPPMTRSVMFSKPFQRGLLDVSSPLLDEAAPMGLLSRSAYRAAPVLSAQ